MNGDDDEAADPKQTEIAALFDAGSAGATSPFPMSALPSVNMLTLAFRHGEDRFNSPCILIGGKVAVPMTRWLTTQAINGLSQSTLEQYAYGLRRFTEYYFSKGGATPAEGLVRGFSHALDRGDKALRWQPLDAKTASRYFDAFCMFFDWLKVQPGFEEFEHPNPLIKSQMTPRQRVADHARSLHSDILHHLRPLTERGKGIRDFRRYPFRSRFSNGSTSRCAPIDQATPGWAPAGMELNDYIRLVHEETEPRNRLLWLLLGAGAARISEALQAFATDIYYENATHEALVALANPVKGKVLLSGNRAVERRQYLADKYGMIPRCLLPRNDPLHAGWKGMMEGGFDDEQRPSMADWRNYRWTPVEWMMPHFGRLFWTTHVQYMRQRSALRPQHPYYFVNLKRNKGAPLTRSAAKQLLESACVRLGIRRHSPHKLRHGHGSYLSSIGMPLSDAQVMMRHRNPASTTVYLKVKRAVARGLLTRKERHALLESGERNCPLIFRMT